MTSASNSAPAARPHAPDAPDAARDDAKEEDEAMEQDRPRAALAFTPK
jgi:hypothetical protein